jgi:hypothetical protein
MAALFEENVLNVIDKNITSELIISKSDSRLNLHTSLRNARILSEILSQFENIYEEQFKRSNNQVSAMLIFNYYAECGKCHEKFTKCISTDITNSHHNKEDIAVLLNFYAASTLRALNTLQSNVHNDEVYDISAYEADNETERALFCLGGGTLCDIIKVNRKRSVNLRLSQNQRKNSKLLLQAALSLSMKPDEKSSIPVDLKDRDRGHMVFPKREMLTYVRAVNAATKEYARSSVLKKLGKQLLQVS